MLAFLLEVPARALPVKCMKSSFARLFRGLIPALAILILAGCNTNEDSPYDTAPDTISPQRILDLVNDVRTSGCDCGSDYYPPTSPVRWNDRLEEAAYNHSVWMEQNRSLSHTGTGGSNAGDRLDAIGYNWGRHLARISPKDMPRKKLLLTAGCAAQVTAKTS